ncbi:hypothetical protein D1P53_003211 [Cryptococcus gattii VGV]|nr:hypothetical protein D1P53_003211 [Cryptococcus gattii VGV]
MKLFIAATVLGSAALAVAAPVRETQHIKRAGEPTDLQVLQYALTLENLEAAFYSQALQNFSAGDFKNGGYPDWVRGRISQIAQHEVSHAKLLSAALGNNSVAACQYKFPYTDIASFISLAAGIENIGVSAYAGANQYITDPTYRSVAATILPVEARHQGFFQGPVMGSNDWTGPYDTPLGLDMVYTLAAQLITSCPSSNAMLPVNASKPLLNGGSPIFAAAGGATISLTYDGAGANQSLAVYNGLGSTMVAIHNGNVTLPQGLQGYSYLIVTTAADLASVNTSNTVAGPAEAQSGFDAFQSNPGFMNPYGAVLRFHSHLDVEGGPEWRLSHTFLTSSLFPDASPHGPPSLPLSFFLSSVLRNYFLSFLIVFFLPLPPSYCSSYILTLDADLGALRLDDNNGEAVVEHANALVDEIEGPEASEDESEDEIEVLEKAPEVPRKVPEAQEVEPEQEKENFESGRN